MGRMFCFAMSFLLVLCLFPHEGYAAKEPELLISELMINSKNVGDNDGYDFIELFNNSNRSLDLRQYEVVIDHKTLSFPPNDSAIIPRGKFAIIWLDYYTKNVSTQAFFSLYKQKRSIPLFRFHKAGLKNKGRHAVSIQTKLNKPITAVQYDGKRKNEQYIWNEKAKRPVSFSRKAKPSPGHASFGQIFAAPTYLKGEKLAIEHVTIPPLSLAQSKFTVKFDLSAAVNRCDVTFKTAKGTTRKTCERDGTRWKATLPLTKWLYVDRADVTITAQSPSQLQTAKQTVLLPFAGTYLKDGWNVADIEHDDASVVIGRQLTAVSLNDKPLTKGRNRPEKQLFLLLKIKGTNDFFANAVTYKQQILQQLDFSTYYGRTVAVPISPALISEQGTLQVDVRAGTKQSPFAGKGNRDDYELLGAELMNERGERLSLSFAPIPLGDKKGAKPQHRLSFQLPETWLTTASFPLSSPLVEGRHTLVANAAGHTKRASFVIDRSGPVINSNMTAEATFDSHFTIEAKALDAMSTVASFAAKLDNKPIELPLQTSAWQMTSGKHQLHLQARDTRGNETIKVISFTTKRRNVTAPELIATTPLQFRFAEPLQETVTSSIMPLSPIAAQDVRAFSGATKTEPPTTLSLTNETAIASEVIATADGRTVTKEATTLFPYHRFTLKVKDSMKGKPLFFRWQGKSLAGRTVSLYAWDDRNKKWRMLERTVAGEGKFHFFVAVDEAWRTTKQDIHLLVQDEWNVPPSVSYSFAWLTDTQYYSASYPHIYQQQTEWLRTQMAKLNIKYAIHTGDVVDHFDNHTEWQRADKAMKVLEAAKLPYGVLAGNHDVGQKTNDYRYFYQYFGENRFQTSPYFAGSYENNRGHYDRMTIGGTPYLFVYMGWGVRSEDIAWMNGILEQEQNRVAILAFHDYLQPNGKRSAIGEQLYQQVVKQNRNVIAILSGHYSGAAQKIDMIDDDDDGRTDRTVYQLLYDYQSGPEGGQGFLRLLFIEPATNTVYVRTYSPYLNRFNYSDATLDAFTMKWPLTPERKVVETDEATFLLGGTPLWQGQWQSGTSEWIGEQSLSQDAVLQLTTTDLYTISRWITP